MRLRQEKRNNIIIRGLQTATDDYKREIAELLEEKLHLKINITEAWSITTARGLQLIGARLGDSKQKHLVMTEKKKLEGTTIYISNDRTKNERAIQ